MNPKILSSILVVITIISILSAAFIYTNYSGQVTDLQQQVNTLQATVNTQQTQLNNYQNQTTQPQSVTVVDDEGNTVTLNSVPQRVVSLAPSNTQIMFAIGAGDKIVGVTDYDTYPYNFSAWIEAGNMTSIGGYSTPNKEAIATLHPDLILATPINDVDIVTLRSLGYNVLVINPTSVSGVLQDISLLGRATGANTGATALINSITVKINTITAKIAAANMAQQPKVYYEIWADPYMSAGSTTWINDILGKVGAVNIFGNETQQYPVVSSESIIQLNPDVILVPSSMGTGTITPDQVKARAGWNVINAIKNNHVVVIDGDLFSEAGPRLADQISAIAAAIYPELFNSP
jgi:iron complex transport system substrate-binding protein